MSELHYLLEPVVVMGEWDLRGARTSSPICSHECKMGETAALRYRHIVVFSNLFYIPIGHACFHVHAPCSALCTRCPAWSLWLVWVRASTSHLHLLLCVIPPCRYWMWPLAPLPASIRLFWTHAQNAQADITAHYGLLRFESTLFEIVLINRANPESELKAGSFTQQ